MLGRRGILGFVGFVGFILAAALLGCACEATVAPIDVGDGCPEQPVRGPSQFASEPADKLIDDFEDGDTRIARVGVRSGSWILGPSNAMGAVVVEAASRCVARGSQAGHFAGPAFTNGGYANWTAVLVDSGGPTAAPYDGRAAGGVSFWAAIGSGGPGSLELPVGMTTMDNAWNGGVCTTECMDIYGTRVRLTPAWQRFMIRFSDLAQETWGVPHVDMRVDQLVGFVLWPRPALPFDIWIDDVRLEP